MTLLELLRQELPKRGGWPEGVIKIHQDYDGETWAWLNHDSVERLFTLKQVAVNARKFNKKETRENMVTRDQYESALAESQKSAWNGEGLPPVGADVEFTIGTYDIETDFDGILPAEGEIVEVIAHKTTSDGNDVAVVYWDDKGAGRSACFGPGCFRPLRTEAERAIDEMVRLSGVSIGAAKILYDVGYRKA